MTETNAQRQLNYGRSNRRARRLRYYLVVLSLAAVGLFMADRHYGWHTAIWRRSRELYWQHRVASEAVPTGVVAYDETAARRLGQPSYGYLPGQVWDFHGDCGGTPSSAWTNLRPLLTSPTVITPPTYGGVLYNTLPHGPTFYSGQLLSIAGRKLVHVTLDQEIANAGVIYLFDTTIVSPATLTHPMSVVRSVAELGDLNSPPQSGSSGWGQPDRGMVLVDRGRIDPADPARFTCEYTTTAGRHHSIEGTLSPNGQAVALRFIATPDRIGMPMTVEESRALLAEESRALRADEESRALRADIAAHQVGR